MSSEDRDRIVANSAILAGDISMLYIQASNDKVFLYSDVVRGNPQIKEDFFLFLQNFYGLVDRTSHHLPDSVDKEYHDFFDEVLVFKFTEDDEDEFYEEIVEKARRMMTKFEDYKRLLKKRGILDLVHQIEVEGVNR